MRPKGSPLFASYVQNVRRIYWAEFIDAQTEASRPMRFRASLVSDPLNSSDTLAPTYEYHRHRTGGLD